MPALSLPRFRRGSKQAARKPADLRCIPWIDKGNVRLFEVRSIARDDGKAVVNRGCGNHEVWLRESVSYLSAFLYHQPPLEHNVFSDRKNPTCKHGSDLLLKPIFEHRPLAGIADRSNPKPNLGEGYNTNGKLVERASRNEFHHPGERSWPPQLRENICIQQPHHQNTTSRTGEGSPPDSRQISLNGEACIAATSSVPITG